MEDADFTEVRNLKIDYFRYLDAKRWADLRSLFQHDATFGGFPFNTGDADEFVQGVSAFLDGVDSVHQGFMPQFSRVSESIIRGRWSMHDYLVWPPDSRDYRGAKIPGLYGVRGYGHYEEEYRYADGRWHVAVMRLLRTRIELLTGGGVPLHRQDYFLTADPEWI
ncbi:nuclear transport factor 2 family protein [Paenarthrobacter nicotinovorans]|uniref:nuclear transport factor 2 family protein n=1 Tax=Paenarthrobacter nicotinovorans TaxID=29320 RepID=UPI0037FD7A78